MSYGGGTTNVQRGPVEACRGYNEVTKGAQRRHGGSGGMEEAQKGIKQVQGRHGVGT